MLSYHNKSYIDGVAYLFRFLMMYTPQLKKELTRMTGFVVQGHKCVRL